MWKMIMFSRVIRNGLTSISCVHFYFFSPQKYYWFSTSCMDRYRIAHRFFLILMVIFGSIGFMTVIWNNRSGVPAMIVLLLEILRGIKLIFVRNNITLRKMVVRFPTVKYYQLAKLLSKKRKSMKKKKSWSLRSLPLSCWTRDLITQRNNNNIFA